MNKTKDSRIMEIVKENNYSEKVGQIILKLFELMKEKEIRGFCHASASILFVCFSELGLSPELMIGEANIGNKYFDHSWICLDNKIIDLAIALPLDYSDQVGPVIFGKDLLSNKDTLVEYGNCSGEDYTEETKTIINGDFLYYMDNAPFENGLWSFVLNVLDIKKEISDLRNKYKNTKRIIFKKC